MNTIERRHTSGRVPVRIEKRAGDKPMIAGLASVYYDGTPGTEYPLWQDGADLCVERVLPGCFDRALEEQDDVRALVNHDPSLLLGRAAAGTLRLSATAQGLAYEIDPPDTQAARDCMESIRRGDMDGSSFAFSVDEQSFSQMKRDGGGLLFVREVKSVRLYDVGPVTYPAYQSSTAGVRSASCVEEARAAFAAWQESERLRILERTLPGRLAAIAARARAVEVQA